MKQCSRCQVEKPLTEFRKGKRYADGYRGQCTVCLNELAREYKQRPEIQQQRRDYDREYTQRPDVLEARRAWERAYKQRPDVKAKVLAYMQRPDVNERVKARERARWQNDPKLRARKSVYLRERYRHNADHKRKQIQHSMRALHARRARKQEQGGSYSAQEWRELCAKYGHVCLCCGKATRLTPDHVVPIAKGGSNDISNIQPLCLPCNLRKSTKTTDYRPNQPPEAFG
jgi:5-methylcytosine-specific restriction endonuclease McrA